MNFKVSVILLQFFTVTVTIGPYAATSFGVLASDVKVSISETITSKAGDGRSNRFDRNNNGNFTV